MTKLGTSSQPAVVRVQTQDRAQEILLLCEEHNWKVIVGIEPDKAEDISDVEQLLNPPIPFKAGPTPGRNDPCPCGSGKKYKKVLRRSISNISDSGQIEKRVGGRDDENSLDAIDEIHDLTLGEGYVLAKTRY